MISLATQQALELASQHLRAGQLAQAEPILRRILDADSNQQAAVQMLAFVLHQTGRSEEAERLLRRAIESNPSNPELQNNLAIILASLGRFQEASERFRTVLALRPDVARAHLNLAQALRSCGQLDQAIEVFQRALASFSTDEELRAHAAAALAEKGQAEQHAGRLDASIAMYRAALALASRDAQVLNNLGTALLENGQRADAIAAFRQATHADPSLVQAHFNLGTALKDEMQLAVAADSLKRVIALHPEHADAFNYLGIVMKGMGRIDEAIAACRRAIKLNPDFVEARNNLGAALADAGEIGEAITLVREALALKPDARIGSNLLFLLHLHPDYDADHIYREHIDWNESYAQPLASQVQPHINSRDADRRLRVGYDSPDFTGNPVGRFLLPLFQNHDHLRFELFCYSDVKRPDAGTETLKALADQWHDSVRWSHDELAQRVRDDRIDILVDLGMHASQNRMLTFARKPAPVQVTYLAYPSTTGLSAIDYRLTDPYLDPPDSDLPVYSEQSVRLPHCFWCYLAPNEAPEVTSLPALRTRQITFGCFNNFYKVSEPALATWCRLLLAAPNSRLVLHALEGSHRQRVREKLKANGVDPSRLEFVGRQELQDYFRNYGHIDIALDPFPYAGGTTTCDALWMGVPVVTLAGRTAVGRGGVSILSNVGLAELIAKSPEQYVEVVSALAQDLPRLAELRQTLRSRMIHSPLMDAAGFARDVESAFRTMWQTWCRAGA